MEDVAEATTTKDETLKLTFDDDKNTALHFAGARGHLEEGRTLLHGGHKVNVDNYLGWIPLMMSTRNGHAEIVRLLLEKRANATRRNKFGLTPLMYASNSDNESFISVPTSKSADQTIKNINGKTAEDILQQNRGVPKPCLQHLQLPNGLVFSPQPLYHFVPNQTGPIQRKSSNLATPNFCCSSAISPVSPIVFFPPDFTPTQVSSPQILYFNDADTQLNASYLQLSPMTFNFPSPCDTIQYHSERFLPYVSTIKLPFPPVISYKTAN